MKKKSLAVLTFVAILVLLVGVGSASAHSVNLNYRWLAGAGDTGFGLLCDFPPFCPDVATAKNGDTVEIRGEGTLSVHPKSVTGGGTFVHKDSGGNIVASGTWTVTKLHHFESYGAAPGFPPSWEAGRALMSVHLVADNGMEADANLTVGCILPGIEVPDRLFEGITLKVKGVANFKEPTESATLFILQ